MSKSIADLRSENRRAVPERTYEVCLRPDLIARVQELQEELETVANQRAQANPAENGEGSSRGRKRIGDPAAIREQELRDELGTLASEMLEYTGTLRLRATRSDGDWRRWCYDHPARPAQDEDDAANARHNRDASVALGFCNADDLIDDLAAYAVAWNDEPLSPGDWDVLAVPAADKKQIARLVVSMYEGEAAVPKLLRGLSASLGSAPASN